MIDEKKHKIHLIKLLREIYEDPFLATNLAFKGGTAGYLFYNLNRFSTDLDFDILFDSKQKKEDVKTVEEKISKILAKLGFGINDKQDKFYTLYWEISYEKNLPNIKIEISKRYDEKNLPKTQKRILYGTQIQVATIDYLIAQKLIATLYRKSLANRDLYDIHFYLSSKYATEINYEYIEQYTELNRKVFFEKLLKLIQKKSNYKILDGLGEVIPEDKKAFVKKKLLKELEELIKMQIDSL
jgi:predicted nucleotidyltransferase component of viral defense system